MGTQLSIDWHNSTSKSPEERIQELKKGKTQKEVVLELLKDGQRRTSFEVQRCLGFNLNSVRRCLTNLCYDGEIVKQESGKRESEGKFNHYYKLV